MIVIPDTVKERTAMIETRAIVVEVGRMAWVKEALLWGLIRRPRAKVGDKVIVSKYCGAITIGPLDGAVYRFVNDDDIYARITGEALEASRKRDLEAEEEQRFEERIREKEKANG